MTTREEPSVTSGKPGESLLARIRKLMALADADRNSNEHEAAAAAAKVQALLAEYNLTMEEVKGTGEKGLDAREQELTERRAGFKWQQALMAALAETYFCLHFVEERLIDRKAWSKRTDKRKSKYHVLIGRPLNIQTTVSMYDYLSRAILRHAKEAGFEHGSSDNNAFFDGAVHRLSQRLGEARKLREREQQEEVRRRSAAGGKGGLVLQDYYSTEFDLNNDLRNGWPAGTTANRRREQEAVKTDPAFLALREKYEAEGHDWVVAFYLARGFKLEDAEKYAREFHKRNERERKAEFRAHFKRTSRSGFQEGLAAGGRIGLDAQIAGRKDALADKSKR